VTAPVYLTPATTDRDTAARWFERFEGAGLDGVIAKPLDGEYEEGKRSMLKVKHLRTADCVVGGFRYHKDGVGVGSLLLGLYDADGVLHHVGVASSFSAAARTELLADLEPHREGALAEHPWRGWAEADAGAGASEQDAAAAGQRRPGAQSRWNAGKDLTWEPLRLDLVAEVAYEHLQGDRFRHTARFQRWRPDRKPSSCTYEQLDVPVPMELQEIFGL
jgi:ATP-dependent DNA ligase